MGRWEDEQLQLKKICMREGGSQRSIPRQRITRRAYVVQGLRREEESVGWSSEREKRGENSRGEQGR